jgi:hypothetical protein
MKFLLALIAMAVASCASIQMETVIDTAIVTTAGAGGALLLGPGGAAAFGGIAHLMVSDGESAARIEELEDQVAELQGGAAIKPPEHYILILVKWVLAGIAVLLVLKYFIFNGLASRTLSFVRNG